MPDLEAARKNPIASQASMSLLGVTCQEYLPQLCLSGVQCTGTAVH